MACDDSASAPSTAIDRTGRSEICWKLGFKQPMFTLEDECADSIAEKSAESVVLFYAKTLCIVRAWKIGAFSAPSCRSEWARRPLCALPHSSGQNRISSSLAP